MKRMILLCVLMCSISVASGAWAGKKLFVGGLPFATTSAEVHRLVSGLGTVQSIKVKSIDNNGDMSAEAVIKFASEEDVDYAADILDGLEYMDERLSAKKKSREIVVVGSKVKDVIREAGFRSDGELVQAVSDKVHQLLEAAIKRTAANKRGTVRPYDL